MLANEEPGEEPNSDDFSKGFRILGHRAKRTLRRQRWSLRRHGLQFEQCRRPHLVVSLTAGLRVVSWLCSRSGVSQNRRELDCPKSYRQSSCP
jgi:hypothetical protein